MHSDDFYRLSVAESQLTGPLQPSIDITVIALSLGHESPATTHQ